VLWRTGNIQGVAAKRDGPEARKQRGPNSAL